MKNQKKKLIYHKNGTTLVTQGEDGLYRDRHGTVYAFEDKSLSVNVDDHRCGVGPCSLPECAPHTPACKVHDYTYSSPAYQKYNSRLEADSMFKKNLRLLGTGRLVTNVLYKLVRVFGGFFWEGKK